MKIGILVTSAPYLRRLMETDLPAGVSFRVARTVKQIDERLRTFDEVREKLCKKYGTLSPDGKQYVFGEDNQKLFNDEFKALLDEDDTSITVAPISISAMPDSVSIKPAMLSALDWLFVE